MSKRLEAILELADGMSFQGTPTSGHTIVLDAAPEVGGLDRGPRPMELLLLGLGGCTGMDVISILRKMRQEVTGYQVRVQGERADSHPQIFTHITVEHVIRGRGVKAASVHRAIELSATRYCSASAMLERAAKIEHTYRITDEQSGEEIAGALDSPAEPHPG